MTTETSYRDRLATAIMQTIADYSAAGDTTAIPARDAGEALMPVLAAMITGTEDPVRPKRCVRRQRPSRRICACRSGICRTSTTAPAAAPSMPSWWCRVNRSAPPLDNPLEVYRRAVQPGRKRTPIRPDLLQVTTAFCSRSGDRMLIFVPAEGAGITVSSAPSSEMFRIVAPVSQIGSRTRTAQRIFPRLGSRFTSCVIAASPGSSADRSRIPPNV
jgi:hypothetical protein